MKKVLSFALCLFLAAPAFTQTPTPVPVSPIHWPVTPAPLPPPANLPLDQLYVIGLDQPATVVASPADLVKVTSEVGPVKVHGKFIDGGGERKFRTFTSKQVVIIQPVSQGAVELIITWGDAAAGNVERRTVTIGPPPPPPAPPEPPAPPVPPTPPAPPAPIPGDGLHALIVYDPAKLSSLPAGQATALYSTGVRSYLNSKCPTGPDGKTKEWRIWPADVDASAESPLWQEALKRPHPELPWIVISNGKSGYEGKLPADVASTLDLLKKYGG